MRIYFWTKEKKIMRKYYRNIVQVFRQKHTIQATHLLASEKHHKYNKK